MDLENFVSSTLVQIVKGVNQAQRELENTGALVNPAVSLNDPKAIGTAVRNEGRWQQTKEIAFDVAVTAAEEKGGKAGAGIRVFGAHLGANGELIHENSTVSRVRFVVPLALPLSGRETAAKESEGFTKPLNYGPSGTV